MALIYLPCGLVAQIDEADVDSCLNYSWAAKRPASAAARQIYVQARVQGRRISLHRFLLNPPTHLSVDHIDGDGLNNRRSNLRVCEIWQNCHNTHGSIKGKSRFIGVHPFENRWRAMIKSGDRNYHLGLFDDPEMAARVRDFVAAQLAGPFARLNLPAADPLPRVPTAAQRFLDRHAQKKAPRRSAGPVMGGNVQGRPG